MNRISGIGLLLILMLSFWSVDCRQSIGNEKDHGEKAFVIIERTVLDGIYSASGMAAIPEGYLLACDDQQFLWQTDKSGRANREIAVSEKRFEVGENGRVSKKVKRDFESIASWKSGNQVNYFVFGSGSISEKRSYVAKLSWKKQLISEGEFRLKNFYEKLMDIAEIDVDHLNIEGSTILGDQLILFNRELGIVFWMDFKEFEAYWESGGENHCPEIQTKRFELPLAGTVQTGFSGASTANSKQVWFSASAEDTKNWIDDGPVAGSYIGWINHLTSDDIAEIQSYPVLNEAGEFTSDKIEAFSILDAKSEHPRVLAVTDSDGGVSEMLLLELR